MKEQRIQQWIKNYNGQIALVETEFASFFKQKPLKDYYQIKVHEDIGYISIDILNMVLLSKMILYTLSD